MAEIEERLRSYERAFEGLLSLTPAKLWDNGDQDDQWKRKKMSKEQRKQAKRAKLDPSSHKSAKDLMDENENEKKRKRENDQERDSINDCSPHPSVEPAENKEDLENSSLKRQKMSNGNGNSKRNGISNGSSKKTVAPTGSSVLAPKQQKQQAIADNIDRSRPLPEASRSDNASLFALTQIATATTPLTNNTASTAPSVQGENAASAEQGAATHTATAPKAHEGEENGQLHKIPSLPNIDKEALRARLHAKIEALRAARKADGIDGKPVRTRQELIEARRQKEAQKKALKKERRKQALSEQQQQANETELARLRGSGSPISELFSPASPEVPTAFSFGRVAFDDGAQLDQSMEAFLNPRKKGRMDPKSALNAAEKKRERLAGLDEEKRAEIAEKDLWLNAKKRAHGEKVRDDVALLKKTVKRKEKAKQKSAKEWDARIEAVEKAKEMKQKKREENLKKRREEKGVKRGGKKGASKGGSKKISRPGFEGSFKSRK